MNYLKNRTVYLSGPIEFNVEDWRTSIKKVLEERFGLNVFDPATDPKQVQLPTLHKLREEGKYNELAEIAHGFVRFDLGILDRSDALIAYLPYKMPLFGTVHEIVFSDMKKKPTILICPEGKDKITTWAFGIVNHKYMFGKVDDMYSYLEEVDSGKHKDNDRWYFLYHYYQENGKWKYR